jgi:hypothetical protein
VVNEDLKNKKGNNGVKEQPIGENIFNPCI